MKEKGIDLWLFRLDQGPDAQAAARAILSAEERTQARQFSTPRLAAAFTIRRAARRIILAQYVGIDPDKLVPREAPSGKPSLPDLEFNASHSSDLGILAVSGNDPVGADIERVRRIELSRLAARIMSPAERRRFHEASSDEQNAFMFNLWTGKEAVLKGIGIGLNLRDLPLIGLAQAPDLADWRQVRLAGRMNAHGDWQVRSWVHSGEYNISLASQRARVVNVIDARELLALAGI